MVPYNFNPSIKHPLYWIRKGLYNKINLYSGELSGRLMDFGCGAKPYQSLFTKVTEYIGVDYSGEGHDHADENIDVYYDGKTLPFADASFDSIFSSEVFEHIFTLPEILTELNRVLKPGGKMLATCPFAWEEHEIPVDFARYTRFALQDMLQKAGFSIVMFDKSGHTLSALHQLFMVYLHDEWVHRVWFFSKFSLFKKLVRQGLVPVLNGWFWLLDGFLPKSDKFYLNTIMLVEKK
ncbi:MAG: class I SAM-dependent methyltransferase [Chitinophagia bacterium]|nr:class I SAM-dependent methyltransferase [Chitinophagia bacterium]